MTVAEIKKQKVQIKCVIKRNLKFQDHKNCLEETQLENKINYIEKNKIEVDSIKVNHQEFIKNNKPMLKIMERFKSGRHNIFR